jgi:hypothetical protein
MTTAEIMGHRETSRFVTTSAPCQWPGAGAVLDVQGADIECVAVRRAASGLSAEVPAGAVVPAAPVLPTEATPWNSGVVPGLRPVSTPAPMRCFSSRASYRPEVAVA